MKVAKRRKTRSRVHAAPPVRERKVPGRFSVEDYSGMRMKRGAYKVGPDFYGCSGTGTAPTVLYAPKHLSAGKDWLVCEAEIDVERALRQNLLDHRGKKFHWSSGGPQKRNGVWAFKTRANAFAKWVELCNERLDENAQMRAEHQDVLRRAQAGDMDAVAKLGDY